MTGDRGNQYWELTPFELVSVPTSKDWPRVKDGSPKTVIAETKSALESHLLPT
jgi:hypothetical protein